ncbi:hypothetical protein [Pyrobaculum aerophilum]|uniref:Uncharacterized protein n=2 Tax=Pyrobaculum aerophilum TaxID=13773 RepID=Q8ZU36_PYRAE|nr:MULTISPECIES: hypothetical protein [Pyrobaculum]AAL64572.1 hypothetical protein PAE2966 [Pyrobaculum aerophilum str. IM2]HII47416.1 hypothetical protein [Pyrobaculum aerophilum]
MRYLQKRKVAELPLDSAIKEVLLKVLGPEEEVYVERIGDRIRVIL